MKQINDYIKESYLNESTIEQQLHLTHVMYLAICDSAKLGYLLHKDKNGKLHRFGISKENIYSVIDTEEKNIKTVINLLEKSGVKFKYETNKEWQEAGYEDPTAYEEE